MDIVVVLIGSLGPTGSVDELERLTQRYAKAARGYPLRRAERRWLCWELDVLAIRRLHWSRLIYPLFIQEMQRERG